MNRNCNRFARMIAGITVLCTVFALVIPVFAQESAEARSADINGKVLHTHNMFCFDSTGKLLCPLPELEEHMHSEQCYETAVQGHVHTDDCYMMERGALTCQVSEQGGHIHTDACYQPAAQETVIPHEHTDACYTKQKGELTCTIPEREGHSHGTGCYTSGNLICAAQESEEHTHGASCYEKVLTCDVPEEAGHTHTDTCFAWTAVLSCSAEESAETPERVLICTETEQPVHVHGDTCYAWTKVLHCTQEEQNKEDSVPAESEKVLVCTKPELQKHTHTADCYSSGHLKKGKLICGQYQLEQHQHTESCLDFTGAELVCKEKDNKEHRHNYRCYQSWSFLCQKEKKQDNGPKSDPNADVETAEIWEKTFEHIKLTGAWSQDLLAIAQTQLGYEESERNFTVSKSGMRKGYTRYGEWYGGVEYGDWCAMFIAFCMHYAGVEGVPVSCSCEQWINHLKTAGMYAAADAHTPRPGDFVFFDSDRALETPETVPVAADHVGIVVEVIPATQEEPAAVMTIEGNYYDAVRYETRHLDDPRIIGYGLLPDGPAALYSCGLKNHAHSDGCYDEAEKLICQVKEHNHDESCRSRKLHYADASVCVDVTLSDAVYLPADLYLRAALVTENEKSVYDAMETAVMGAVFEYRCVPEDKLFCQMQLFSGGKPYELPAGMQADVQVTFEQPVLATKGAMNAAERYTLMLIEKTPEEGTAASYQAVELTTDRYKSTGHELIGVSFTTDRISAFSVVVDTHKQTNQEDSLLKDLISFIAQ